MQNETNRTPLLLNHLSFPTVNVEVEARFFEEHLGAVVEHRDAASGSALLRHGSIDIVLEKMSDTVPWHRDFHFGFELATRRDVEAIYEKLKQLGVHLDTEIFNRIGRGSRFFARTPGGIQLEINTREDAETKYRAPKG